MEDAFLLAPLSVIGYLILQAPNLSGVSQASISKIESNIHSPSIKNLFKNL
ncbi:helix-turn-helix transcriptional regulator [Brevibacterium sp. PAMC23299]|nr:helix-turn-helix transcriptional regulator [Brevibacterium sp. PAMC23299]